MSYVWRAGDRPAARSPDLLPCPDATPGFGVADLLDDGSDGVLEAVAVGDDCGPRPRPA